MQREMKRDGWVANNLGAEEGTLIFALQLVDNEQYTSVAMLLQCKVP